MNEMPQRRYSEIVEKQFFEKAIQSSKEFIEWHKKAIADYEESIKLNQECLNKYYSDAA